jgi:hypothetical protein
VLTTSCTLHDVQGNFLHITLEREGEEKEGGGDAGWKGMNVIMKSHSLLLLARVRMAVVHRVGVSKKQICVCVCVRACVFCCWCCCCFFFVCVCVV